MKNNLAAKIEKRLGPKVERTLIHVHVESDTYEQLRKILKENKIAMQDFIDALFLEYVEAKKNS
jgi:hypothetical protein